jgi:hypothetical protein
VPSWVPEAAGMEAIRFMESLIGLMVLLMVGAFLMRLLERKGRHERSRAPVAADFMAKESPFTAAEARFLRVLDDALGEEYRVFAKLRLADLLDVRGERGAAWLRAFNQISAKHVDFVVCRRETLEVVAAVELDDRSHQAPDRQRRDAFVDRVFATAELPLVRVPVRRAYLPDEIRAMVLGVGTGRGAMPSPTAAADGAVASGVRLCHVCGSQMELRTAQRGSGGSREYYACTNTRRCRVTVAVRDAH